MLRNNRQRTRRTRRGRKRSRGPNQPLLSEHTVRSSKITNLNNSGAFMPSQYRTSLRIAFERSAAASTSLGTIAVLGNDVFDPLGSAGSAQPVGYDQLAILYNRYRVIGSQIELRATIQNTNTSGSGINPTPGGDLAFYPSNSPNAPSTYEDAVAQPFAKYGPVTAQTPQKWRHSMSTSEIAGQAGMRSSDRFNAQVSASPAEQWYWVVVFKSAANYVDTNFEWHVQITYDVEFYDRAVLNESSLSAQYLKKAMLARFVELEAELAASQRQKDDIKKKTVDNITRLLERKEQKITFPGKPARTVATHTHTGPMSLDHQGYALVSSDDYTEPSPIDRIPPGTPARATKR